VRPHPLEKKFWSGIGWIWAKIGRIRASYGRMWLDLGKCDWIWVGACIPNNIRSPTAMSYAHYLSVIAGIELMLFVFLLL